MLLYARRPGPCPQLTCAFPVSSASLVFCSSERFVVLDYAHRSLVQSQGCGESPTSQNAENSFYLTLLENHQGRSSDRLCRAPTQ